MEMKDVIIILPVLHPNKDFIKG